MPMGGRDVEGRRFSKNMKAYMKWSRKNYPAHDRNSKRTLSVKLKKILIRHVLSLVVSVAGHRPRKITQQSGGNVEQRNVPKLELTCARQSVHRSRCITLNCRGISMCVFTFYVFIVADPTQACAFIKPRYKNFERAPTEICFVFKHQLRPILFVYRYIFYIVMYPH